MAFKKARELEIRKAAEKEYEEKKRVKREAAEFRVRRIKAIMDVIYQNKPENIRDFYIAKLCDCVDDMLFEEYERGALDGEYYETSSPPDKLLAAIYNISVHRLTDEEMASPMVKFKD